MTGIHVRIMHNLKERVYATNEIIALHGIEPVSEGRAALRDLVRSGKVELRENLYTLSYEARQEGLGFKRIK